LDWSDSVDFVRKLVRREVAFHLVKPIHALFFITYRCSSRCTTCVMWKRGKTDDEISLEQWERVVDQFAAAKFEKIEMFGGDAILRADVLFPLMKYAVDRGVICDLTTNGILMNEENARQSILAKPGVLYVSIDGVGDVHDSIRGVNGAFKKAVTALRNLKAAREALSPDGPKPLIVMNTTISKRNVNEMESLFQLAEEEGPDVLALEYVGEASEKAISQSAVDGILPDPYFVPQSGSCFVSEKEALSLKQWIEDKRKVSRSARVVFNTENIDWLSVRQMSTGQMPWRKCYVCRTTVLVDPSGNVLCCPFFSKYSLGNLMTEPLHEIWGNERHRRFIRAQAEKKIAICDECVLTIQRNPSFVGSLANRYSQYWKRRKDKTRKASDEEGRLSKEPC